MKELNQRETARSILDRVKQTNYKKTKIESLKPVETDGSLLCCPKCGDDGYLHQNKVETFFREEDATTGLHTTTIDGTILTSTKMNTNPSPRRDGIRIQFDVVIGNPPYSENKKTHDRAKLWGKFVEKSMTLLKDSGIGTMITPTGWMSNTNMYNSTIVSNLVYADASGWVSKQFGSTGGSQKFCWFMFKNSPSNEIPTIKFDDKSIQFDLHSINCTPVKSTNSCSYSIMEKMEKSDTPSFDWRRTSEKNLGSGISVPLAKGIGYIVKFEEDDCVEVERHFAQMNKEIGTSVASNLNLKLYKHYRWVIRSGAAIANNWHDIKIPTTSMTDEELYEHFNLTQEEIDYIESNVK